MILQTVEVFLISVFYILLFKNNLQIENMFRNDIFGLFCLLKKNNLMLMMIIIHTFMNLSDRLLHALPTEALFLQLNVYKSYQIKQFG